MFNHIELAIKKLEYLIVTLENFIISNNNLLVNIICNYNYIKVQVPPIIPSDDLDIELEFTDDENDLYEYISIKLITSLYDKGILVGDDNTIYNYYSHPKLTITINDRMLWDLVGEIIIAKQNLDDDEVSYLVSEKKKCLKRQIKRRINKAYLQDLDNGIDNIETIFRRENHE